MAKENSALLFAAVIMMMMQMVTSLRDSGSDIDSVLHLRFGAGNANHVSIKLFLVGFSDNSACRALYWCLVIVHGFKSRSSDCFSCINGVLLSPFHLFSKAIERLQNVLPEYWRSSQRRKKLRAVSCEELPWRAQVLFFCRVKPLAVLPNMSFIFH